MLTSFGFHNSFFSGVYMDDISDMTCQIHHLHLEQYLIQQQYDIHFQHLCYHFFVFTSAGIYTLGKEKIANIKC